MSSETKDTNEKLIRLVLVGICLSHLASPSAGAVLTFKPNGKALCNLERVGSAGTYKTDKRYTCKYSFFVIQNVAKTEWSNKRCRERPIAFRQVDFVRMVHVHIIEKMFSNLKT
jgi:hypothetical protein